jgi:hypothetical protein
VLHSTDETIVSISTTGTLMREKKIGSCLFDVVRCTSRDTVACREMSDEYELAKGLPPLSFVSTFNARSRAQRSEASSQLVDRCPDVPDEPCKLVQAKGNPHKTTAAVEGLSQPVAKRQLRPQSG